MWLAFKRHYPYAAATMIGVPMLLGDPALFVLGLALAIVLVPCAYASDVDEIVDSVDKQQKH